MNQDFRVSVGFICHPKTIALRQRLKDTGIVCLISLWSHAAAHNWKGDLVGYLPDDVARVSGWKGRSSKFVDALVACGFLDCLPQGGYRIHDWSHWNEYATQAEKRVAQSRHAANKRHGKVGDSVAAGNSMSNARSTLFPGCPLPPSPPDETTRYRREEEGRV